MLRRPPLVLWRYIGLEIIAIFALALIVQSVMNIAVVSFQLVQNDGLTLSYIWPFLSKISILSTYYTLPISLLFAVTLGFGRMVADREVTALKACGLSYLQLMAPALSLGLVCAVATDYLNGSVLPEIGYQKRNLGRRLLTQLTELGEGTDFRLPLPRNMGRIYCGRYRGNILDDVFISVQDIGRLTGESAVASGQEFPIQISARRAEVRRVNDRLLEVDFDEPASRCPTMSSGAIRATRTSSRKSASAGIACPSPSRARRNASATATRRFSAGSWRKTAACWTPRARGWRRSGTSRPAGSSPRRPRRCAATSPERASRSPPAARSPFHACRSCGRRRPSRSS